MSEFAKVVTNGDGLDALIGDLGQDGRAVIGPTVRDGVIAHDVIHAIADLPQGWTEEQDGGTYRLARTGTDERFAYSSPAESWKKFVFPPKSVFIRARRTGDGIKVAESEPEPRAVAFFGIRSCDLAALTVLDRVFLDSASRDPQYGARRADVFIVAVGCSTPGNTCFCTSMGTGPSPTDGFDLSVTEISGQSSLEYLIEAGSSRGDQVLRRLPGRSATEDDRHVRDLQRDRAVAAMGRTLDPALPPLAARHLDHPHWQDVAERCLACGNCTMVCPTCFCTTTEDTTSLDGQTTERARVWDSCFSLDFSYMHGGSTRTSTSSRYRQWLLHKLVTWHDQFDSSGCVGCGRCITWCPVGIDLTAEIAALAESQLAS